MTNQIKVPVAVLERFLEPFFPGGGGPEFMKDENGLVSEALAVALEQFCEELLGKKAIDAARLASIQHVLAHICDESGEPRGPVRAGLKAAIDSVVKGGSDDSGD